MIVPPADFPEHWYGPGTEKMRNIIMRARSIAWFEIIPSSNSWDRALTLVEFLVTALRGAADAQLFDAPIKVTMLEGEWSRLHQGRWGTAPYNPWGDRWEVSDETFRRVVNALRLAVDASESARALLLPPLWPVPSCSNVHGAALVANEENAKKFDRKNLRDRDRCVAWALLCRAEDAISNALLWEMAVGEDVIYGANPFQFLLELYEYGYFPMGLAHNCYELFVPKIG